MRFALFLLLVVLTSAGPARAQRWDNYKPDNKNVKLTETNLPIVFIEVGGKMIQRDSRINARMKIIHNGDGATNYADTTAHPGQHIDYEGNIAISYRGNSSFDASDKKPYSLHTLDKPLNQGGVKQKVSLLGMGKDNKWGMLAPYSDKSMMRDLLAFELNRPWVEYAPSGKYCELILDGTYYGVYILCELVTKGKHRLDLDDPGEANDELTGGYLMEVDRKEGAYYTSRYHPMSSSGSWLQYYYIRFQYKHPDYEDMSTTQRRYIQMAIDNMEKAFASSDYKNPDTGYAKYIDVTSFIDYQLATELGHNVDGYRLSGKFYKRRDSEDSRFHTVLWDMNLAYGNSDYYQGWRTDTWVYQCNNILSNAGDTQLVPFWWYKLNSDPAYTAQVKARWAEYRNTNHSDKAIAQTIDSMVYVLTSGGAVERNSKAWPRWGRYVWPNKYVAYSYNDEISHLKTWIAQRITWMDKQLGYDPTSAQPVMAEERPRTVTGYYTLDGIRLDSPPHGIYIVRYSDGTSRKEVRSER